MKRRLLPGVFLLWVSCAMAAGGLSAAFDQANRLYEQGKYSEAAQAYEHLLGRGNISPALYFNLGNAWLKSGQAGRAIANYRLAETLTPRDSDVRANLQFARNAVNAGGVRVLPQWLAWSGRLTLNEWGLLCSAALWIWFGLLAASEVGHSLKHALRGYTATVGVIVLLLGGALGLAAYQRYGSIPAVVVAREVVLRYGPLDESQSFFTLRDGAEVLVLGGKDDWLQVSDAARRVGWLRRDQVIVLAPGRNPGKTAQESPTHVDQFLKTAR